MSDLLNAPQPDIGNDFFDHDKLCQKKGIIFSDDKAIIKKIKDMAKR